MSDTQRKYKPLPQMDVNLSREFIDISNTINDVIDKVTNVDTSITSLQQLTTYQRTFLFMGG